MRVLTILAALIVPALFTVDTAQAQARWLRTVEIIAPVSEELGTAPLLDSLINVAQEKNLAFRRSPDPEYKERIPFRQLEDALLQDGLDVTSANRVFVNYRFEADDTGFRSKVTNLFFIYRPEMAEDADIPIFMVSGSDPEIERVLTQKGTQLRVNEAAFKPFIEQIQFTNLISESTIVRLGDEIIRDEGVAADEKRRLLATIRSLMY